MIIHSLYIKTSKNVIIFTIKEGQTHKKDCFPLSFQHEIFSPDNNFFILEIYENIMIG